MLGLWVVMKIKLISIFVNAQELEKHNIYYIHNGQQRP